jgi:tripartite-type tricarboxylate transporter receptor subunit TctC
MTTFPASSNRHRINFELPLGGIMDFAYRKNLQFIGAAAVALAFSQLAIAQTYPTRPITMIVPYSAGANNDTVARILAERMRTSMGQPIIVENVTGADGSIGVGRVARARPDGYTIALGDNATQVLNGALYSLQYDPLNDFALISPVTVSPYFLAARKTMAAKDLHELIAWLKGNPNTASAGITTSATRILSAVFRRETATHFAFVPYRGGAPTVQDLVAGQIDLSFFLPFQLLAQAGNIKAYAVTSDTRLALAPDLPTFREMGLPALSMSSWSGLFAPRNTPKEIVSKLRSAAVEALADPMVRSRLTDIGQDIFPRERQTPEALAALVKADAEKWWPLIKEFGIKAE